MGKSKKEIFDRLVLARTGFKFEYMTGIYLNKEGKMYHLVYDFAWMEFSNQKILIVRKAVSPIRDKCLINRYFPRLKCIITHYNPY
jgi:hypothetical protein